jgi:hypothetical protein
MKLLSIVAALLIGHPVNVHCYAPRAYGYRWPLRVTGATVKWSNEKVPHNVYLRDCRGTIKRKTEPEVTFAHELLHVQHWNWPHKRVYANQWRYHYKVDKALKKVER